jgi:hypothetical protein
MFNDMKIISVYAPLGSECKREREEFFNISIPQLLRHPHSRLINAGDFNCVLQPTDTTGTFHTSTALRNLVTGMDLHDSWDRGDNTTVYTHYTHNGAARLDRIYIYHDIYWWQKSIPSYMQLHLLTTLQQYCTSRAHRQ